MTRGGVDEEGATPRHWRWWRRWPSQCRTSESIGSLRTTRAVATWSALVLHARRIPLFTQGEWVPCSSAKFQHGGIIGEIPPLHQPKSNLRGDAYLL